MKKKKSQELKGPLVALPVKKKRNLKKRSLLALVAVSRKKRSLKRNRKATVVPVVVNQRRKKSPHVLVAANLKKRSLRKRILIPIAVQAAGSSGMITNPWMNVRDAPMMSNVNKFSGIRKLLKRNLLAAVVPVVHRSLLCAVR